MSQDDLAEHELEKNQTSVENEKSMDDFISRYKNVTNNKPNEFVLAICEKDEDSDENEIFLKLCGNNHLFTSTKLTDEDIGGVVNTLIGDRFVTGLDLRYNRITDKGAELIGSLLQGNHCIIELNLMGNDIEEQGAISIANGLQKNNTLTTLKMTGNKIGKLGGMAFAQALQINTTLEYLDVGECDLEIDSVIALATVLNYNTSMRGLNVNRPILWTNQDEQVVHMADLLQRNRTLLELHLAKFRITDFGADRLADSLMLNYTITILDLSCNRITRDATENLARVLKENTSLMVLDLAYNRVQDDGAIALADALGSFNTRLKVLALTFNEIQGEGLCALAKALHTNETLSCIYIWGNELETSACAAFGQLLNIGRLSEEETDVRPYIVDDVPYLAHVQHDCDYRRYRFTVPIYGDEVPKEKSYALM